MGKVGVKDGIGSNGGKIINCHGKLLLGSKKETSLVNFSLWLQIGISVTN